MNIIARIDDFLIDRVFQRLVDALAHWSTPRSLASFFTVGATLGKVAWDIHDGNFVMAVATVIIAAPFLWMIETLAPDTASTALPPLRLSPFGRIPCLALWALFDVPRLAVPHDVWDVVGSGAYSLLLCALYVAACRRNLPPPKRVPVIVAVGSAA